MCLFATSILLWSSKIYLSAILRYVLWWYVLCTFLEYIFLVLAPVNTQWYGDWNNDNYVMHFQAILYDNTLDHNNVVVDTRVKRMS